MILIPFLVFYLIFTFVNTEESKNDEHGQFDMDERKYGNNINFIEYKRVKNSLDFTGKVALVTGSNSGIGNETVRLFSYLGAQVVVTGRNKTRIREVAYQCWQLSPKKLKVKTFFNSY